MVSGDDTSISDEEIFDLVDHHPQDHPSIQHVATISTLWHLNQNKKY